MQLYDRSLVLHSSVNETRQQLSFRLTSTVRRQYQSRSYVTMSDSCDLTTWAQRHISAIYEAQSEDDLHHAFEAAFSPSLETFVNHERVSRESIKDDMVQRRGAAISSSVKWENVMAVPKDREKPDEVHFLCKICLRHILMLCGQAGIVAGFLIVTRSLRFRIRVSHAQLLTILTINAK